MHAGRWSLACGELDVYHLKGKRSRNGMLKRAERDETTTIFELKMARHKTYLVWGLGLLALVLAGCQPRTDNPGKPEVAGAALLAEQGESGEAYRPQPSAPPAEDNTLKLAAVSDLSPEIRQLPLEVQEAYRFALANPDVLDKIPCYCGCNNVGHLDNRMCYIQSGSADRQVVFDDHAAG
jgi:hypothetical protein